MADGAQLGILAPRLEFTFQFYEPNSAPTARRGLRWRGAKNKTRPPPGSGDGRAGVWYNYASPVACYVRLPGQPPVGATYTCRRRFSIRLFGLCSD